MNYKLKLMQLYELTCYYNIGDERELLEIGVSKEEQEEIMGAYKRYNKIAEEVRTGWPCEEESAEIARRWEEKYGGGVP